jgi:hypothetical protein
LSLCLGCAACARAARPEGELVRNN